MNKISYVDFFQNRLYVDNRKITDEVRQYLCKSDGSDVKYCVTIKEYDYDVISRDIKDVLKNTNDSLWVHTHCDNLLVEFYPFSHVFIHSLS